MDAEYPIDDVTPVWTDQITQNTLEDAAMPEQWSSLSEVDPALSVSVSGASVPMEEIRPELKAVEHSESGLLDPLHAVFDASVLPFTNPPEPVNKMLFSAAQQAMASPQPPPRPKRARTFDAEASVPRHSTGKDATKGPKSKRKPKRKPRPKSKSSSKLKPKSNSPDGPLSRLARTLNGRKNSLGITLRDVLSPSALGAVLAEQDLRHMIVGGNDPICAHLPEGQRSVSAFHTILRSVPFLECLDVFQEHILNAALDGDEALEAQVQTYGAVSSQAHATPDAGTTPTYLTTHGLATLTVAKLRRLASRLQLKYRTCNKKEIIQLIAARIEREFGSGDAGTAINQAATSSNTPARTPKPKQRRKRKKRSLRGNRTAFNYFQTEERARILTILGPAATEGIRSEINDQIQRMIGMRWRNLDLDDRSRYVDMAEKYNAAKAKATSSGTTAKKEKNGSRTAE